MEPTTTDPAAPPPDAPVAVPDQGVKAHRADNQALYYIAAFKMAKALLFFAAATGLFRMVHHDTRVELLKIIHAVRIDGDAKFIKGLLIKADLIDDPRKRILGSLLTVGGILFTIEGVGLMLRKTWAEYFTVIMTASGIPFELYELFHRAEAKAAHLVPEDQRTSFFLANRTTGLKMGLLVVNVAILWYLINHLRRSRAARAALEEQLGEVGNRKSEIGNAEVGSTEERVSMGPAQTSVSCLLPPVALSGSDFPLPTSDFCFRLEQPFEDI